MTARHSALDEPFFREWRIARAQGGGTSAVASGNAGTPPRTVAAASPGTPRNSGTPLARSKDRSAVFRDLLGLERALPVPAMVVVGSKGKGTAVAAASYALHQAGLRVGTVTSPPLRENRERIRIDGQAISAADYARLSALCAVALEQMPALDERGYLSPSGLFTLVGIRFLLDAGVDVLVIEEGLGGLSDEVSLFDYPVVVLTQIFAEHTDVLGGSLASVAADLVGVVTAQTRRIVSHPQQSAEAQDALRARIHVAPNARAEVPASLGAGNLITEINLELGAAGAQALIEECRATTMSGHSTLPASPAQSDPHSAVSDAPLADSSGTSLNPVPQAHPVDAWRAGALSLPGRASAHELAGGTWLVDAAISAPGVRAARNFAARYFAQRNTRYWHVVACFPDTKDVEDCLRELHDLPVMAVAAGTDYLTFRALEEFARQSEETHGQSGRLLSAAEAARRFAGRNVLAVGTMSFVGEIIDALDAPVDAWW